MGGGYQPYHQQQQQQQCAYQSESAPSPLMQQSMAMNESAINSINMMSSMNMKMKSRSVKSEKKEKAEVEAAIVKIAPKTIPVCICGGALSKVSLSQCYPTSQGGVSCDDCGETITAEGGDNNDPLVWHCPKGKNSYQHPHGYDLCLACGQKQLQFDELNGLATVQRDTRYPIRVTLQFYKSTQNGLLDADIMGAIKKMLTTSRKQADFVGSLVTHNTQRPTEPDLVTQNEVILIPKDKYAKITEAMKMCSVDTKYLANFKREEVEYDDLKDLCKMDLKELIPKMGPRNRFWNWLQTEFPKESTDTDFMNGLI